MEIPPATTRPVTVAIRTTIASGSSESSPNANASDYQAPSDSIIQSAVPVKPRFR